MKIIAWTIVVAGFVVYGLGVIAPLIYPPAHPSNPIEDMQMIFSRDPEHLRFNLTAFALIIVWGVSWAYVRKDKE